MGQKRGQFQKGVSFINQSFELTDGRGLATQGHGKEAEIGI